MASNDLEVRPTRPEEAPLLPPIERSAARAFLRTPELAWVATDDVLTVEDHQHFVEFGGSWVALVDEAIVGFVCAERYHEDLHVWEVSVELEVQGRGVGRALMEAVAAYARRRRLQRITLTTFREVPWNEGFYRRLGYRVLEPDELDDRLSHVLEQEGRRGIPLERRCAMTLSLTPSDTP